MGTVKYTGPVASFHCPTNAEIRSLKVHFSPKQEGSGDPSPENVRPISGWTGCEVCQTGVNVWNEIMVVGSINSEGIVNGSGRLTTSFIPVNGNTQYRFVGPSGSGGGRFAYYDKNKKAIYVNINTSPTANSTFTTEPGACYMRITINRNYGETYNNDISINYPSTDTTYHPHSGSTTNYEFGVLGKNKFNWDVEQGHASPTTSDYTTARSYPLNTYIIGMSSSNYYRDNYTNWVLNPSVSNGIISFSSGGASGYGIGYSLKLMPNQTYFLSGETTNNGLAGAIYYDKDGALISTQGSRLNKTITIPDNTVTTMIVFYSNATNTSYTFSNIQLELGSSATTYESYDPNHTVYGGWVDLITGEVCEEWYNVNPSEWTKYKESNGYYAYRLNSSPSAEVYSPTAGTQRLSNIISQYGSFNSSNMDKNIIQYPNYLALQQDIDIEVVEYIYKLVTPITYHLDPTQLQTFLGQNNVWSNADYVEVEYDLHETQTILTRKQFIIANQPHIVKPAAAPLQNFVTDVPAPLKECKVYFSPMQEGEGDPSPDNVRAISGWTGCEVYRTKTNLFPEVTLANFENYATKGNYGYWYTNPIYLTPNTVYHLDWTRKTSDSDPLCLWGIKTYSGMNYDVTDAGTFQYYCNGANGFRSYASFNSGPTGIIRFALNKQSSQYSTAQDALDDLFAKATFMLTVGTTAIPYEPYSGTTLPIDWIAEAGTVYGGYVDLVTGEIWETHRKFDCADYLQTTSDIEMVNGNLCRLRTLKFIQSGSLTEGIAEKFVSFGGSWAQMTTASGELIMASNSYVGFSSSTFGYTTKQEWLDYLIQNHITFSAKSSEPVHVATLTPTQLKTLRGTNNIWSSANGDVEIAYWTH